MLNLLFSNSRAANMPDLLSSVVGMAKYQATSAYVAGGHVANKAGLRRYGWSPEFSPLSTTSNRRYSFGSGFGLSDFFFGGQKSRAHSSLLTHKGNSLRR